MQDRHRREACHHARRDAATRPTRLLGCGRQAGLDAGRLRPVPRRPAARARQPAGGTGGRPRHARGLADRRGLPRGGRDRRAKVADALALDWPRDRLELVVAVDGGADPGADATAERARAAGADVVLELPRGGKVRAQDAAVAASSGELVAFSDANSSWEPGALRALVAPFADPAVAYACGQVRFLNEAGTNQEGVYWRYEMWLRANESALASVTAGNGAIYALRRTAYMHVDAVMGHDLAFPFNVVKRGRRAVYAPDARAVEKMVPTIAGEGARKRRMMSHAWAIMLRGGMLSPRGYPPLYALMIVSHRRAALRIAAAPPRRVRARRSPCCAPAPSTARRCSPRPACSARRPPAAPCACARC